MTKPLPAKIPEMSGVEAYPRKNGEPVFEAPWQSRSFGMVVGLHTSGIYPWDDFKELLIEEIAKAPCKESPADANQYYLHWVTAFGRLLVKKGIVSDTEMQTRTDQFREGERQEVY